MIGHVPWEYTSEYTGCDCMFCREINLYHATKESTDRSWLFMISSLAYLVLETKYGGTQM